jgi:hypothetical protein
MLMRMMIDFVLLLYFLVGVNEPHTEKRDCFGDIEVLELRPWF